MTKGLKGGKAPMIKFAAIIMLAAAMLPAMGQAQTRAMTGEDAATRFCEAYNARSGDAQCQYEDPFFGQSSVDLFFKPSPGFSIGHVVEAFSANMMCDLMFEGFTQYQPPVGEEIKVLRNEGWALRLIAEEGGVTRVANTCEF